MGFRFDNYEDDEGGMFGDQFFRVNIEGEWLVKTNPKWEHRFVKFKTLKHLNRIYKRCENNKNLDVDHVKFTGQGYEGSCKISIKNTIQTYDVTKHRFYQYINAPYPKDEHLYPSTIRKEEQTIFIPGLYDEILESVSGFLEDKEKYAQKQWMYRLGMLLYGPPGNGKTAFIRWLVQNPILPKDTMVIWCNDLPKPSYIKALKKTNCFKILVFEEITSYIDNSGMVKNFLQFMDGEESIDNCITIATTNYPENLPGNIVDRPSRFDKIIKVGNPEEETRKFLLDKFLDRKVEKEELKSSKDFSVAQLKECVRQHLFRGLTFTESCQKLKNHQEFVKKNFSEKKNIGIGF